MNAEIIAIGSELLTPFHQDTNSLFLSGELNKLGVEVEFKTVVGDSRANLVAVIRIALARTDIVMLMGGLGPTEDDLTREAVSEAMRLPLHRNPDLLAELYARFASRRIKMPDNNQRQADLLEGASALPNANGTAPGQWLDGAYGSKQKIIILLPGPPRELKPLYEEQVLPRLREKLPEQHIATRVLKVALMGEGECDSRCAPIYKKHERVQTTILFKHGEVQLHLRARSSTMADAQKLVEKLSAEIVEELEDHVFSTGGESLEQIVGYFLGMRDTTLAVAESCTGGLLAERITSVPGSSRYFLGGAIVYDNAMKALLADVPPLLIEEHGAVSKQVAQAMAEGIRKKCNATLGVGITGIAGPGGGTEAKPVGLVYVAVTDGHKTDVVERKFPGDRDRVRWFTSQLALDMVRRTLL